ncbi:hypothetical protein CALCODRAFT_501007 [Calocera cornea HHB12733]|uniref:Uncharacterized protein n=1 Tax=Calocera cornea HHB12733 TaxID=1353952 RepID=A0A165DUL0_9BASI|nr:hypothetical protein CALCODRAFT_501007 [Calocera cornea HHB12733]
MPKERASHASYRERKPYDRPPAKAPPTQLSKRPHAPSPVQGGGLTRSTSLLGSLARLVSNPLGWLRGGDVAEENEDQEGDMQLEAEEGGAVEGPARRGPTSGPPRTQIKRRPSGDGPPHDDQRRKRLRVNSPPRGRPSKSGYGDVPDLAASLAKKRHPVKAQTSGELMPPPPPPVSTHHQRYDPRYQRSAGRAESVDMDTSDKEGSSRLVRQDARISRMDTIRAQSPPTDSRFGLTARSPFGRASSLQPSGPSMTSGAPLRAPLPGGSRYLREGSVLSDRSMMSVDTTGTSRRDGPSFQMVPYGAGHQSLRALTQPPDLGHHSAEAVLRALESFRTPLSNSRAPVLPASRINVPIPDKHKQNVGSPYARPVRRKAAETAAAAKSGVLSQAKASTSKGGKGKERAEPMEEGQPDKDTEMRTEDDIAEQAPAASSQKPEAPMTTSAPKLQKSDATTETAANQVTTPAPPIVPAMTLPIPSGPMIPIPKVDLPAMTRPAGDAEDATGFRIGSYDTKGKSSLRVGKQNITRQHQAAAGSDRSKADRHGPEVGRPSHRGTNVFKMPEDEEDEDIAEKPAEKPETSNLPKPQEVAKWFEKPKEGETAKDVPVMPVIEPRDFFKDSLTRLATKSAPVPPMPSLFAGITPPAAAPTPSPPTSLVFNANISGAQPSIQFSAPKAADAPSKPAFGAGLSPFDAVLKTNPPPRTLQSETSKPAEPPKFSFTSVKPPEPAVADGTSPAKPALGNGPSPFGAFTIPKSSETKNASPASAPNAFSFSKPATSDNNAPVTLSFGQQPAAGASGIGAGTTAFKPTALTTTAPSWNAFGQAKEAPKSSIETVTTPATSAATSFGFGTNGTAPSNPFSGTVGSSSPFGKPSPANNAAPAVGASSVFGLSKPVDPSGSINVPNASGPPQSSGFTFGAPPTAPTFGGLSFGKKPDTDPTKDASKETPKPLAFGAFGSAFGAASGSANAALKTGGNSLGLTTPDTGASKPAFSVFGSADAKPAPVFGSQPLGGAGSAGVSTPSAAEKPKTPPPKESSPDKMETSPVRDVKANSLGAQTTTPGGAPPTKSIFPTFGTSTPSANLFGGGASSNIFGGTASPNPTSKEGSTPANLFGAPSAGSAFSFSFGANGSAAANPFAGANSGPSPFGNPFGKPPIDGAATNGGTATPSVFGASATVATPERPQSSGFPFGAPPSTGFAFGQPAQSSPFGGSSTGLPAGTPPLSFGAVAPSGDAASNGLQSPAGGSFNLGAADNTARRVKGLPSRRKRM